MTITAEECIRRILIDIDKRKTVDYGDPNSVRRYNAAYDRIIKYANFLFDHYPEKTELFMELVYSPDYDISSHCVAILFHLKSSTVEHKKVAIAMALKLSEHPDEGALGRSVWKINAETWTRELEQLMS